MMDVASERLKNLVSLSPQQACDVIVEEAMRLTDSPIGYFAIMNETGDELTMVGWSKTAMDRCSMFDKPISYPLEQTGVWGDCIRERQAVIINDYERCERVTKKGYPDGHVQVVRHMNVPIHEGDELRGIIGVGNKPTDYTPADAAQLQAFADATWLYIKSLL